MKKSPKKKIIPSNVYFAINFLKFSPLLLLALMGSYFIFNNYLLDLLIKDKTTEIQITYYPDVEAERIQQTINNLKTDLYKLSDYSYSSLLQMNQLDSMNISFQNIFKKLKLDENKLLNFIKNKTSIPIIQKIYNITSPLNSRVGNLEFLNFLDKKVTANHQFYIINSLKNQVSIIQTTLETNKSTRSQFFIKDINNIINMISILEISSPFTNLEIEYLPLKKENIYIQFLILILFMISILYSIIILIIVNSINIKKFLIEIRKYW